MHSVNPYIAPFTEIGNLQKVIGNSNVLFFNSVGCWMC